MALLSPGYEIKEKDFSTIVPAVSTKVGAMAGRFLQGPIEVPVLISNQDELEAVFGKPADAWANDWFTIANFLSYSNSCWVVRSAMTNLTNATASGTALLVKNYDSYEGLLAQNLTDSGDFIAKQPGTIGNAISVIMIDKNSWTGFNSWCNANLTFFPLGTSLATRFPAEGPTTTEYVQSRTTDATAKNDELYVLIVDRTGEISGTPWTILERYEGLSKAIDATNYNGSSIYYKNVLNESSQYVYYSTPPTTDAVTGTNLAWGASAFEVGATGVTFASLFGEANNPLNYAGGTFLLSTMSGGTNGTVATLSNIVAAFDKLSNKDLYDINLVMTGAFGMGDPVLVDGQEYNVGVEQHVLNNVVGLRKDCVGFVSPNIGGTPIKDSATATTKIRGFKTALNIADDIASYGFMDTGMKYMHDKYNAKYRWVPLNGDIAGLAARSDDATEAWYSFAGYNRGGIKNVVKLAYNPDQADRDYLYPKGINPVIIDISTSSTLLLGDRTMTSKPSAFDRINVRRLFITIERAISMASKWQLFEFNDNFTRAQFKNMVEPYLRNVQARRGVTEFLVICDATNNTGQVIDRNEFVAEIYIKPARSINFITLSFVATRTDVTFNTVIGG